MLNGDQVRVRLTGTGVRPAGGTLILDVYERGVDAVGQTPVYLGPVSGSQSSTARLTGCPCLLANLTLSLPPPSGAVISPVQVAGSITVSPASTSGPARAGGRRPPPG